MASTLVWCTAMTLALTGLVNISARNVNITSRSKMCKRIYILKISFSEISMTAERSVEMKFDGVFSELSAEETVQFQGQVHNKLTPHVSSVVLDNYQCTEGRKTFLNFVNFNFNF